MAALLSRRAFVACTAGIASALPGATSAAHVQATADATSPARPAAQEPRGSRQRLKLSCNLYSFNEPLRSGALSLAQAVELCAELGFDAVDPTGYYFAGYPTPPADGVVYEIRRLAFSLGLGISGTGIRNDFTLQDPTRRQAELRRAESWFDVASKLGAPVLRVFDGRGETKDGSREEMIDRVVEGFRDCAALGAARGVVTGFQNHDELIKTASEVLAVRERVRSPWFALNVDIGSLRTTADPYEEIARLAPHACTWQIKESVYRKGVEEKTDLRRIAAILRGSGYRGYLPLETLGPGDPKEKVRRWLGEVREALA